MARREKLTMGIRKSRGSFNALTYLAFLLMTSLTLRRSATACPVSCSCHLMWSDFSERNVRFLNCSEMINIWQADNRFMNISEGFEMMTLSGKQIENVSEEYMMYIGRNITELQMKKTDSTQLKNLGNYFDNLVYLNLVSNNIEYLPKGTFARLGLLKRISFAYNRLTIVKGNSFYGLDHLVRFNLSHNHLIEVVSDWFRDMSRTIETVDLSYNEIHILQDGDFHFLRNLKELRLDHNHLVHLHDMAFLGIISLDNLRLDENQLMQPPSLALQKISKIDTVDLSANRFHILHSNSFYNTTVGELKLNSMRYLTLIDATAFDNLPELRLLEICYNKYLSFIDPNSFVRTPKLTTLLLHHNNLSTIEESTITGVSSLERIDVRGNNFVCDCSLKWLIKIANHQQQTDSRFTDIPTMACSYQGSTTKINLVDINIDDISDVCAPRILQVLLPGLIKTSPGNHVSLSCRAFGRPTPNIQWKIPSQQGAGTNAPSVISGHVNLGNNGTLSIGDVFTNDGGVYKCTAKNTEGEAEASVKIQVGTLKGSVIVLALTENSVMLTWHGISYQHEHKLTVRKIHINLNITIATVHIKPYMRSYTISDLKPLTTYQACLTFIDIEKDVRINCTDFITKEPNFSKGPIGHSVNMIIGFSIGTVCLVFLLACVSSCLIRRYNERQRKHDDYFADHMSEVFANTSLDNISDVSRPITYENFGASSDCFDIDDIEEIRSSVAEASGYSR
ncbi:unnamed protein product [Owenia fusiformis]|uniref:Ig-like domain-containing protein n=1 Tax=Owenia fusiformis TaxID=6347 RepID=A0A8S4NQE7_OWEFU|nr:unnamed protein product [Owenia fusiformis]